MNSPHITLRYPHISSKQLNVLLLLLLGSTCRRVEGKHVGSCHNNAACVRTHGSAVQDSAAWSSALTAPGVCCPNSGRAASAPLDIMGTTVTKVGHFLF